MNRNKKTNLTINIYGEYQLRSSTNPLYNNNTIKLQSNSIQILYPQMFDKKTSPSVPVCQQQGMMNENVDRKIEAIF